MAEFLAMAAQTRLRLPHLCAEPLPLLPIEDGCEDADPRMHYREHTLTLHHGLDSGTGLRYMQAFAPFDVHGEHACRPWRALQAVRRLYLQSNRSLRTHGSALRRLVNQAVVNGYFRFSKSYPLLEYLSECLDNDVSTDPDSDSYSSTDSEGIG